MAYQVTLKRSAQKEIDRLPAFVYDRIIEVLVSLKINPLPHGVKELQGRNGYRLRVGEYRILYLFNKLEGEVVIYEVGHRKEVYRDK
jgi:mRNA interferase RelE/StbE